MNKEIKEILEIQEDIDYKKLSIEDILFIKEYIEKLEKKVELYQDTTTFGDYVGTINNLIESQGRINKANELLSEILVVSDWEHKGRFRPVKNTTCQDVYKTIIKLNELFETPYRHNYNLLQRSDKSE